MAATGESRRSTLRDLTIQGPASRGPGRPSSQPGTVFWNAILHGSMLCLAKCTPERDEALTVETRRVRIMRLGADANKPLPQTTPAPLATTSVTA